MASGCPGLYVSQERCIFTVRNKKEKPILHQFVFVLLPLYLVKKGMLEKKGEVDTLAILSFGFLRQFAAENVAVAGRLAPCGLKALSLYRRIYNRNED